jgi:flavin-dependent dehydrogenase
VLRVADVAGLTVRHGVVSGVVLAGGEAVPADLVLDAGGRNTHASDWLVEAGASPFPIESTACGLLYYSRHYRIRDDDQMPPYASLLGGPRGDLGYLAFATFLGDNGTFSVAIMVPAWDENFRRLRDTNAFDRVASHLPGMAPWLAASKPASPVLPMGRLRNTLRRIVDGDRPIAPGLIPLGDALSHTNPTFAFGASLSLSHGVQLADLSTTTDPSDLAMSFNAAVSADILQRFRAVSAEDADRLRLWSGEPLDVTDRSQSMAMFLRFVVYRAAVADSELLRAVARRLNALDLPDRLTADEQLLDRGAALYASLPPIPVPPRATLLNALTGAA